MKVKLKFKIKKEVDLRYLKVAAKVRYWEDAKINGIPDDPDSPIIPCRSGDIWSPVIDIDRGYIVNWYGGYSADIHYKVCDAGNYYITDKDDNVVMYRTDNYVPDILSIGEVGYGDYIILKVDAYGKIDNWVVKNLEQFKTSSKYLSNAGI